MASYPRDLLAGDVALVTGAAQGIGAAAAAALAAAGAKVAACDIDEEGLARTLAAIEGAGATVWGARADVTDAAACRAFAAEARAALGPVSILVNNAGALSRDALDAPGYASAWDRIFRVNVDGARNMTLACLDDLRARDGRVINLASILSRSGGARASAYAASKGAVAQFTRALAVELAPDGVRVNAIAPGVIATPMTESTRADPGALGRFMARTPMARVGEPEEAAAAVVFLVSPLASYITGAVLPVDGGYGAT